MGGNSANPGVLYAPQHADVARRSVDRKRQSRYAMAIGPIVCLVLPTAPAGTRSALREWFADLPGLAMIHERRRVEDRRRAEDRREVGDDWPAAREQRRIVSSGGRRIGQRRGHQLPFRVWSIPAPPELQRLAGEVTFVQRQPLTAAEVERMETGWLITDLQAGRSQAFDDLDRRYRERVRAFLASRLWDARNLEDATQEVLFRALRALGSFDAASGSFGPWLFGIARNHVVDHARGADRLPILSDAEWWAAYEANPELLGDSAADHDGFLELIKSLPLAQRQVLVLRYVADLSWNEIAQRLGRSPGAVRMLQLRAHQTLRAEFGTALDAEDDQCSCSMVAA
jgi:RNA polymerase sigma-70 factor (ECF subfamily)